MPVRFFPERGSYNQAMQPRTRHGFSYLRSTQNAPQRVLAWVMTLLVHGLLLSWYFSLATHEFRAINSGQGEGGDDLVVEFVIIAPHTTASGTRSELPSVLTEPDSTKIEQEPKLIPIKDEADLDAMADEDLPVANKFKGDPVPNVPKQSGVVTSASLQPSSGDLGTSYRAVLRESIRAEWNDLSGRSSMEGCSIQLSQRVGGAVASVGITDCSLTESEQRLLKAAVIKAQPLPYAGFEDVFVPDMRLNF